MGRRIKYKTSMMQRMDDIETFTDWVYQSNKNLGIDMLEQLRKIQDYVYDSISDMRDEIEKLKKRKGR